jgi:hypothetical protein
MYQKPATSQEIALEGDAGVAALDSNEPAPGIPPRPISAARHSDMKRA